LALALLEEGYKIYCLDNTVEDYVDERIEFDVPEDQEVCLVDL
jgi:hypothetical protein